MVPPSGTRGSIAWPEMDYYVPAMRRQLAWGKPMTAPATARLASEIYCQSGESRRPVPSVER